MQVILQELRATIRAAAPEAVETIGYQMPTFNFHGNPVYFAVAKKHIGLYPASSEVPVVFKDELAAYKGTKGSIHFPIGEPLPLGLITKIVQLRVEENQKNAEMKAAKKKKTKK